MGSAVLGLVVIALAVVVAAIGGYLTALGAAALLRRPRIPEPGARRRRFAVLIPAHNEASVIDRVIRSVREQTYPARGLDIFVVADNCTDATATIAREAGAIVHERVDAVDRAKGHALRWLLPHVREHGRHDAYIVVDADSILSSEFVAQMDARLQAGSRVIQAHYRVLNATASPTSALREAALASLHYLRPRGRAALGLSCGLKGNGMCFDAAVLDKHGWSSVGLAEDVELHLALVRAGIRVDFAPEATVSADMPTNLGDAASQNLRWEAGRLGAVRQQIPSMLAGGLARGDAVVLDAAIEQLIPPLSVAFVGGAIVSVAALVVGSATASALAVFGTVAIAGHVVAGLIATRAPTRTYLALAHAPRYVVWKVVLYARAVIAPAGAPWIRTRRSFGEGPRD